MNCVDSVICQVVVTTYNNNDDGKPTADRITQPLKIFRAATSDVWAYCDKV